MGVPGVWAWWMCGYLCCLEVVQREWKALGEEGWKQLVAGISTLGRAVQEECLGRGLYH